MSQHMWKWGTGMCLLAILCAVLAVLQYRWIGEVADAERIRLKEDLQNRLSQVRRNFDDRISAACSSFVPASSEIERLGREQAYLQQYHLAISSQKQLIRRVALAIPREGDTDLLILDSGQDSFSNAEWPPAWSAMRTRLRARLRGGPIPSGQTAEATLVELPRFGGPAEPPGASREQEWLVLELNTETIRNNILPAVLANDLGSSGRLDYDVAVVLSANPSVIIYKSPAEGVAPLAPDATVGLLDIGPELGPGPQGKRGYFNDKKKRGPPTLGNGGGSAWLLSVEHQAGSLEALAATTRRRNVGISAGILLLIVVTAAVLMRASQETERVAELQMNFVAGVSHELRTPLTVIRTAAFNLRKTFASNPEQVGRYGELIEKESEKLGTLVEQVLRYGSANSGSVIQPREPVEVEALIDGSLRASRPAVAGTDFVVEKRIETGLPLILADEEALKHALQNLFDNAAKHGADGRWIGIFASVAPAGLVPAIEIRVADRGPGIPPQELAHIFDPFFRGQRAVEDQVHGTGLGLNLVKRIIEAHGGSIHVKSEPMRGTEFIVRIPTVPRLAEAAS